MLIQAYCQQEREKRCTITAKSVDPKSSDKNEAEVEKMDEDESTESDGSKTPKAEPNASPTPNDVEMIDATVPTPVIKQEPEDEVTSIETDALNENANESEENVANKSDNKIETQADVQSVKVEADENGNVDDSESNKENDKNSQNDSNDEPIKIEESTNDKDDPYSKDINIDPRTYCKLGHFHLLLEDYAKGTIWMNYCFISLPDISNVLNTCSDSDCPSSKLKAGINRILICHSQQCLHIRNFLPWKKSTGGIRHFCMDWAWYIIITTHIDGEYQVGIFIRRLSL